MGRIHNRKIKLKKSNLGSHTEILVVCLQSFHIVTNCWIMDQLKQGVSFLYHRFYSWFVGLHCLLNCLQLFQVKHKRLSQYEKDNCSFLV